MNQISNISYLNYLSNSGITSFIQDKPNNLYKEKIKESITSFDYIKNVEDLQIFIKNLKISNAKINMNSIILSDGDPKSNIMLIGKNPSLEEVNNKKLFIGETGNLLNKMLGAINIKRAEIYITNIFPWNIINNKEPLNNEIIGILPVVQKHIEIIKPNIIILMGDTAAKSILNSNLTFSSLRGKWHEYQSINHNKTIPCIVTYHPNLLLKSPEYKKQSWDDLKLIKKKIYYENF
jgi:uracil-DNA glycosylase family 4